MSKRIVFVGRDCHEKTLSDQFLLEVLAEMGDLRVVRRDRLTRAEAATAITTHSPDLIVYWQTRPSSGQHFWPFRHVKQVWVPMYDDFAPLAWRFRWLMRYAGVKILSFSQKLHDYFTQHRIPTMRCTYFPKPVPEPAATAEKPPYTIFLWQRVPQIDLSIVSKLFPPEMVRKVIYKTDGSVNTLPAMPFEVEHITTWLPKEDLLRYIAQADYYIAPRPSEGIGHGFLEAMGMGKIVIANDHATMNEYIQDGVTGHLYNEQGPISSPWASPQQLVGNLVKYSQAAHATWLRDREKIKQFLLGPC